MKKLLYLLVVLCTLTSIVLPFHVGQFGAGVASADGENWLKYGGVPYGYRSPIELTAGNATPANYKIPITIYQGNKTVETGTWTVNSKTYNNRVAFTVHTHEALAAAYPLKIVVDTASLVTGDFFGGSTSGYAKTPEWTSSSVVTDTMKYWCAEAGAATPELFNTSGTIYYVNLPSGLAANTDHTMYMYVDADISAASTNYDTTLFSFFDHFDTTSANLTAFLSNYTKWEVDPATSTAEVVLTSGTTWAVPSYVSTVQVLVVAGGGGGGLNNWGGGGGGAGGVVYNAAFAVTPGGNVTYSIGAGGAGDAVGTNGGLSGSNSTFGNITSAGGGGGGSNLSLNGKGGGSGGGGGAPTGTHGHESQTPDQGYDGGDAASNAGAGGGGAGAVGANAVANYGSAGGIGVDYSAIFSSTFGDPSFRGWVAGGGSAGGLNGDGAPGKGGGGQGHGWEHGHNGSANTGGGGGSGGGGSNHGADGGSGVIVVKYTTTANPVVSVGSSILTVTGGLNNSWSGIATKTSNGFTATNFRTLARISSTPTNNQAIGMFDNAGIGAANGKDGVYYQNGVFARYVANTSSYTGQSYFGVPFTVEVSKYGTFYQIIQFENQAGGYPDISASQQIVCTNESHKIWIGSYTTGDIDIDWIAVMPEIEEPPYVKFPDILYEKAGTVFLDNKCLHWPYDIAFADDAGNITLKWWNDPLTQLNRQSGDSMQVTVRVTDDLSSNQTIYIYYGHNSITSTQADCDPEDTYDTFDAFANAAAWTTEAGGNWTVDDVIHPALYRGDAGNIGGGTRGLWARIPLVIKWGSQYKVVYQGSQWEVAQLGFPYPSRVYCSTADSPTGPWGPSEILFSVGNSEHMGTTYSIYCVQVWPNGPGGADRAYIIGLEVGIWYSDDFETWINCENGDYITSAWILANCGGDFTSVSLMNLCAVKVGSTYYLFFSNFLGGSPSGVGYVYTTDLPENWDTGSWTYGDKIISGPYYEDISIIHDAANSINYLSATDVLSLSGKTMAYHTCTDANFPGNTTTWSAAAAISYQEPLYSNYQYCPNFFKDDIYYYLYFIGGAEEDYVNSILPAGLAKNWAPNWITVERSSTLNGNFIVQTANLDSKYKQATTTGNQTAYVTASSVADGEIISEVNIGASITGRKAGIIFRYDASSDNGYAAYLDYNAADSKVFLYKNTGGVLTELGSTYDIPLYPIPQFFPGFPWRLRIQFYGTTIKVAYSAWGNEWIETHSLTDATYSIGKVGVGTSSAEGYFNNFRVRGLVENEPTVTVGIAESFTLDISNTPSSHDFGVVQPSTTIWASVGEPSFPLADGDCIGNVTNNSSFAINVLFSMGNLTGGTQWTIGASPASNIFRMRVYISGAGNSTAYTALSATPTDLIHELAAAASEFYEFALDTPTNDPFSDGVLKSGEMLLTAEAH